nr:MAG TPA: hypothetical protein [Caudoviricetes sp.]
MGSKVVCGKPVNSYVLRHKITPESRYKGCYTVP